MKGNFPKKDQMFALCVVKISFITMEKGRNSFFFLLLLRWGHCKNKTFMPLTLLVAKGECEREKWKWHFVDEGASFQRLLPHKTLNICAPRL
jgi:hypothetical protein